MQLIDKNSLKIGSTLFAAYFTSSFSGETSKGLIIAKDIKEAKELADQWVCEYMDASIGHYYVDSKGILITTEEERYNELYSYDGKICAQEGYNNEAPDYKALLSPDQFKALSYFAVLCLDIYTKKQDRKDYKDTENKAIGVSNALIYMDVPHYFIQAVSWGNIKGLVNYNRLSYLAHFEKNYDFTN